MVIGVADEGSLRQARRFEPDAIHTYIDNYISAEALEASGASAGAIYSFASSEAKLTSPKASKNAHFSVVRGNSSWSDQTKNYSSNDRQDTSFGS